MKIENKILAILLVFAFVMSIGCVFEEDAINDQSELSETDIDAISVSEDESVSASPDKSALAASSDFEDTLKVSQDKNTLAASSGFEEL